MERHGAAAVASVFAAASVFAMASGIGIGFSNHGAYFYMNLVLILQLMWSLFLACEDIFALRNKKYLHTRHNLLFIVCIDMAMAILIFTGASASAGLTILIMWDMKLCGAYPRLACRQFALSTTLAFITWLLQAASAFSGFRLLASFF
ncbi:unnamed protein product [Triticum turgidum subsp. durum]|uniref:CASP-like protein n=1 Tax=Triticum turgidum subsp. durum TaxID=4567 RepID=A0A9R0RYB1_TRITD|nr:unnamed protein product [Triticum turgidum subsp. durum]